MLVFKRLFSLEGSGVVDFLAGAVEAFNYKHILIPFTVILYTALYKLLLKDIICTLSFFYLLLGNY